MAPILGALFAILICLLAIRPYINYQQQSFENIQAANTASQFRQLIDAAEIYVQANCLQSANNGAVSPACQNTPLTKIPQLALPTGTNVAENPYGQQWNLAVTNTSSGVVALLYSSGGRAIPTRLAAQIAAETGQEGGFIPTVSLNSIYGLPTNGQLGAVGAYGHWSLSPLVNYISGSSGVASGDLVALLNITTAGSGTSGGGGDNDYLYRTAVQGDSNNSLNTMQTNLGMSGHTIQNAGAVNVTTSLPQSTAPFLAQMVGTTANNNPGGMVETTDSAGDTAIMETDSTGSTLAISTAKNASSLNLTAGKNSASLTLADNNSSYNSLKFISTAQIAGNSCQINQVGTIAPDAAGSGFPVVCTKQTNGLSISGSNTSGIFNVSYNFGVGSNRAVWQSVSGGATQSMNLNLSPYPTIYINNTPKPLFIASNCNSGGGILVSSASIQVTIQGPNGEPSNQYSSASNSLTSVGIGGFYSSPVLSVIIPPKFYFNYATTGLGACTFMATY